VHGKIKPVKSAYEISKAGGKHAGHYITHINLPDKSLRKAIRSYQRRIQEHKNLIKDPKKYIEVYKKTKDYLPWDQLYPDERVSLLGKKWPSDIKRLEEQKEILERILKNRQ
jgi:hypothetical protein